MILHVDMDAFYASVEERERPELVGKPVIVGGTPAGRGVVAAANYVARKYGVHSAMPTATALRLCPQAIVLQPRMGYYAVVSEQIREILFRFTPLVEPLSLDEAFLDVTGCERLFGSPARIGRQIKQQIHDELRLIASVGVAPNKFLSKIASDLKKPDGFVVVDPADVQEFLDPLPVGRLWGVGRVTGQTLEEHGVRTIGDVRRSPIEMLTREFGQSGEKLWNLAHGIDRRQVVPDREAKSISHETTFPVDIGDPEVLRAWLVELSEHVGRRMRRHELRGRTLHLKLRFADFHTIVKSKTLAQSTNSTDEIRRAAAEILETCWSPTAMPVRLLGIGISAFDESPLQQRSLFIDLEHERRAQLDRTTDEIRDRFGSSALNRASGLLHDANREPDPRPEGKKAR